MIGVDVPDGQPTGCTDIQLSSPVNGASSGLESEGPRGLFGLWSALFGCASSCPRGKACAKEVQNLPVQPDRCPFGHGSVGAAPYPTYVHGARGGLVCPAGCVPKMEMRRGIHTSEAPHQALVREMIEYQELYHRERGNSEATKQTRIDEILQEISETGTYNLTLDELEHGARVAWRNAPKCANRKFWEMLTVMDFRHVKTNQEMFQACLELCEKAIMDGAATTNVGIFRAQTPGTKDGPRIWNSQLYRFAYHKVSGLGDPAEEEFTEILKSWGWKPSEETNFDILPLVCQMDPLQAPEMFEIPKHYQFTVAIEHPEPSHAAISDMGLRWYGVPIVSNMEFSIGGLLFTAAPFNGWYSVTEIIRNYTDEGRYNLCKPVAEKMGYDTLSNASMYKDQVVVDLTKAILYSFRRQGTAIVDHHTLLEQFFVWYNKERQKRGYVPGNWKWIIPPIAAHLTPSYLQLNKMTEYTLTPALFYAPGSSVYYQEYLARTKSADEPEDEEKQQEPEFKTKDEKAQITIIYATTAGTSKKYARHLVQTFSGIFKVALLNVEDFEDELFCTAIEKSVFFILVSSTYGAGSAPPTAAKFLAWLRNNKAGNTAVVVEKKPYGIIGLGDSSYPRFCAAVDIYETLLLDRGAGPCLLPSAKCNAKLNEEISFWDWVDDLLSELSGCGSFLKGKDPMLENLINQADADRAQKTIPNRRGAGQEIKFEKKFTLVQLDHANLPAGVDTKRCQAKILRNDYLIDHKGGLVSRVTIDKGPRQEYFAGDEIQIFAQNSDKDVEAFAKHFDSLPKNLDNEFILTGSELESDLPLPNTHRYILKRYIALHDELMFSEIQVLACLSDDANLKRLVLNYEAFKTFQIQHHVRWLDMFKSFPALWGRISVEILYQVAPRIRPRYYSISSAPHSSPNLVDVTVGKVAYKLPNGADRTGFCSSWLTSSKPGQDVDLSIMPTPHFRLPLDLRHPVILVATGTGIAPFRSFWQELAWRKANYPEFEYGPKVLIFGCRNASHDYLYHEEVEHARSAKVFSGIYVAVSRPAEGQGQYVQDLIQSEADQLLPVMTDSCHIYVCGSSHMNTAVSSAFNKILGKEKYQALVLGGRWHEDVFGAKAQTETKSVTDLELLARSGWEKIKEELNANTVDIHSQTWSGNTMLHLASAMRNNVLVGRLLEQKASPLIMNFEGLTPAMIACIAGDKQLEQLVSSKGGTKASSLHKKYYLLHAAVVSEDIRAVRKLLASGADPNQPDCNNTRPVHLAAVLKDTAILSDLIQKKADLNMPNRLGLLPAQTALKSGRKEAAALIKSIGGNVTAAGGGATGMLGEDLTSRANEGMLAEEIAAVQGSWSFFMGSMTPAGVEKRMKSMGVDLFCTIFEQSPAVLELFPFKWQPGQPDINALEVHSLKVLSALTTVIEHLCNEEAFQVYLEALVLRHLAYKIENWHYNFFLTQLLDFLLANMPKEDGRADEAFVNGWSKFKGKVLKHVDKVFEVVIKDMPSSQKQKR